MKSKFLLLLIFLIAFSSCTDEFDNSNKKDSNKLAKFNEQTIELNIHNYLPAIISNLNGNSNNDILLRNSEVLRDSLWPSNFGKTIFAQSDESLILPHLQRYIFIGSLLKGNSISDSKYAPISSNVKPITVSVSFPAKVVSGTISSPSLSSTREFINKIIQQQGVGVQTSSMSFKVERFTSYDELKVAFGSNVSTGLLFKKQSTVNEESTKISKKTGLYVTFIQKNFTLDMDIPTNGSLIQGSLTNSQTGGYDPVYASSITYGRMGVFVMETNESYEMASKYMKEAFDAVFVKGSSYMSKEAKDMLKDAESSVYLLGGDGDTGLQTVDGYEAFLTHIKKGGSFTSSNFGVPIYTNFSYLSDNSHVKIKFKFNVSTDPIYARVEYNLIKRTGGSDGGNEFTQTDKNDIYLAFYKDTKATIPTIPPSFIKFGIQKAYLFIEKYDGWETKRTHSLDNILYKQNTGGFNKIQLEKNVQTYDMFDYNEYIGEGGEYENYEGYLVKDGDFYRTIISSPAKYDMSLKK